MGSRQMGCQGDGNLPVEAHCEPVESVCVCGRRTEAKLSSRMDSKPVPPKLTCLLVMLLSQISIVVVVIMITTLC